MGPVMIFDGIVEFREFEGSVVFDDGSAQKQGCGFREHSAICHCLRINGGFRLVEFGVNILKCRLAGASIV
jgi:hypothetical protein